ncbi:T9SS type B sorting domain-containing protein, partial [Flavobacterium sp.]|uniref:T9SS type B sorting domain-containing protein n=1 Tax=Flavobacterium sp. TaxID=239 RepID=UPI0037533854
HLTLTDSQTGFNAILQNPYCNINSAFTQTIYVRVFDPLAPACSSYTTLQLIVNPKPIASQPNDYHLCEPTYLSSSALFNLTGVLTPQVLGTTLSSSNHVVSYYLTQGDALGAINPLVSPYPSGSKKIWIRVQNTTSGCVAVIFVNLVVDPLPNSLPFYPQYELCETVAPIGKEFFNLTSKIPTILNGQTGLLVTFYPTLALAQLGTGAITNTSSYENTPSYAQTLGIRITNTTTGCYVISTMDLVVNPKPQPNQPSQPYTVCDSNQDGIAQFNLNNITSDLLLGVTGVYTISYHLTLNDATSATSAISTSVLYQNIIPFTQVLYVRAENPTTHCFTVIQVTLNVDPAPMMPTSLAALVNCDQDANTQDGCTSFNLNLQTPLILAAQSLPGSNYTVTYYTNQADASASPNGILPIVGTSNYTSCNTATIWVRIENKTTNCFAVGSFQLQVNTPIVLTTPTLLSVCDSDNLPNNLYTTFNMSGFVGVVPGHTLSFFLDGAYTQPILHPEAFVNTIAATQTVFIVATSNTTGCKSYRTLTIEVLPIPTPRTNLTALPLIACDSNNPNDGYEVFDLTTNAAYIMNNDANVTLHYYATYPNALANTNEIIAGSSIGIPTAANVNGNVWIRVESNYFIGSDAVHCYVIVEQPVVVNPLPLLVQPIADYQECDDDTDGFTLFNLNSQAAVLLATNPLAVSNYSLSFYTDAALSNQIATPGAFTNTNTTGNTQVIYVVASNTTTLCKSVVGQFTIVVNPKPLATAPSNYSHCDDDAINNGYFAYPLDVLEPSILTGQSALAYTVTFYNTQADAQSGSNVITNESGYMAYTHTVWVRVENNTTKCFRLVSFAIVIEKLAEPIIYTTTGSNVICVDFNTDIVVRDLTLSVNNAVPGNYTYEWFEAGSPTTVLGTGATYLVNTAAVNGATRNYTVVMTSVNPPQLGCASRSASFAVVQSGQAVIVGTTGYTITNAFSENQTITVSVNGYGTYQYSLDDGPRQDSNVFDNVSLGEHNITVWDSEGGIAASCDPLVITEVQTIDYPHYFTPNGDGINDTWNIVGLANQVSAKIYIFDRQGKLIKQISPTGKGWDGTYNGNLMISTDYWFTVDYNEADALKQFRA